MKKLMYCIFALILCSCENNEMFQQEEIAESRTKVVTRSSASDVFVEDGYLVVKDFEALDSISDLIAQMPDLERIAWENKMKFESAYTYFKPYFEAFDALATIEEMENYQERYKAIIKVINDEECCDIDYPFQTRGKALILSKDGKIKIGNSLWIYKADRKITINNATQNRVKDNSDVIASSEDNGIYVDYYNAPKTRLGQENGYQCLDYGHESAKNRKYYWSLDLYKEQVGQETRTILALYQQAKKKKTFGGYNVYNTNYSCTIHKLIIQNSPAFSGPQNKITSSEGRGGQYFKIFKLIYPISFPSFNLEMSHSSRGCSASGPLKHIYSNTNPFPSQPNYEIICRYSGV